MSDLHSAQAGSRYLVEVRLFSLRDAAVTMPTRSNRQLPLWMKELPD